MEETTPPLYEQKKIEIRHPRLTAGAYFAVAGFVSAAIPLLVVYALSIVNSDPLSRKILELFIQHTWAYLLAFVAIATVSSFIAGATYGARIFLDKGQVSIGAGVVVLAHVICGLLCGSAFAAVSPMFILVGAICGFLSVIGTAIVTLPLGCIAAWRLVSLRDRIFNPSGCRVHGYRE